MAKKKEDKIFPNWKLEEVVSKRLNLMLPVVESVVEMLDDGATIPFIARYRKEKTKNLDVSALKRIHDLLEELRLVEQKINTVYHAIDKQNNMCAALATAICDCQTMLELDAVYTPFKKGRKGTLASRARELGLEPAAKKLLQGKASYIDYVKAGVKGISSKVEVETSLQYIISDVIHKDQEVLKLIRELLENPCIFIECKQASKPKDPAKLTLKQKNAQQSVSKFENYFQFKGYIKSIKPHQVLAINRGEELKILKVNVDIPSSVQSRFQRKCKMKFLQKSCDEDASAVVIKAIDDCWSRFVTPHMTRSVRSQLTKMAVKSSIEVFANNLKNLLLTSPVKDQVILGIDPGFAHGCKCAVISPQGRVLDTGVFYLNSSGRDDERLKNVIRKYKCELVAIGSGTACRQTETVISEMIERYKLKLKYCIVDECGASIYSCSDEASRELPSLDPSLRGGVSIARRLQDPMAELVKINPKHIGVGQYQHDLPVTELQSALDLVVEECVSFVGVDLNTCSEPLLRRVSGLNALKAKSILEWRESRGCFVNRNQLKMIKGIGEKTFQQCAGFLQIKPKKEVIVIYSSADDDDDEAVESINANRKGKRSLENTLNINKRRQNDSTCPPKVKKRKLSDNPCPLDATWIHPESYSLAEKLMKRIGVNPDSLGENSFIEKVKQFCNGSRSRCDDKLRCNLAHEYMCGVETINLILDAFLRPFNYDLREADFHKPVFKKSISSLESLSVGAEVTGIVRNVTHFGAFVDIGVGTDALIHISAMRGRHVVLGNKVEVKVTVLDIKRRRINVSLLNIMR